MQIRCRPIQKDIVHLHIEIAGELAHASYASAAEARPQSDLQALIYLGHGSCLTRRRNEHSPEARVQETIIEVVIYLGQACLYQQGNKHERPWERFGSH